MNIKPLYLILGVVGLLLLAFGGILGFNLQTPESTQAPQTDISRYTADQVIAVAQAQFPACFKQDWFGTLHSPTPSIISVKFMGGSTGAWEVNISCPSGYHLQYDSLYGLHALTLYFWESDGALHTTRYP